MPAVYGVRALPNALLDQGAIVDPGRTTSYLLRLNNAGSFAFPPTRVEAMYAPEIFGEAPNPPLEVKN